MRFAQRYYLRLQRRELAVQSVDVATQGRHGIGRGIVGSGLELGQLLVMVVRFGGKHGGAEAQRTDHQGLKMLNLHGAISRGEKGGSGGGKRRA
ncbi:hypothetical protein D3C72_1630420 [compost metagenome]